MRDVDATFLLQDEINGPLHRIIVTHVHRNHQRR